MKVVVLSGGVGGARFVQGLVGVIEPSDVTVVGNVGDDLEVLGLHVSPDLDSILYALAGVNDEQREGKDDRLGRDRKPAKARHDRERQVSREVLRADADGDRGHHAPRHERRGLTPGAEEAFDEMPRVGERVRAEEDPCEADDLERDEAMPRTAAAPWRSCGTSNSV